MRQAGSLVAACKLLVVACMWDLVPGPGIEPRPPALGVQSLSRWTPREVPQFTVKGRQKPLPHRADIPMGSGEGINKWTSKVKPSSVNAGVLGVRGIVGERRPENEMGSDGEDPGGHSRSLIFFFKHLY